MPQQHFFYSTANCPCCCRESLPAHRIREDARVYLAGYPASETVCAAAGSCIGVVWTARPLAADAGPRPWGPARPDKELEQVLDLYREAHEAQTSAEPGAHLYIRVLHLCHIPLDEDMEEPSVPWKCGYHESVSTDEKPRFLIAAWGTAKDSRVTSHALRTKNDLLDRKKWNRNEMLFFIQDNPPCTRGRDPNDRRLILARQPEELVQPSAWSDPAFQSQFHDLAYSLKTYIVGPGSDEEDVMELGE